MRLRGAALACVLACTPAPWPKFPRDKKSTHALIEVQTTRPPQKIYPALTGETLLQALSQAAKNQRLIMGLDAIILALNKEIAKARAQGRNVYLLFGTHHDSAAQIALFKRMIGPLGLFDVRLSAVELFDLRGRWSGVPQALQSGEHDLLQRARGGDQGALRALYAHQHKSHYTAWKYDYLREVMELVWSDRTGVSRGLIGCDSGDALQRMMRNAAGEEGLLLRDLGCALVLKDALHAAPEPHLVTLFWGQAHLRSDMLPRFLPTDARLLFVHLVGARRSEYALSVKLERRLALTGPALVPLEKNRWALLLHEGRLFADLDLIGDSGEAGASALTVETSSAGVFHFDGVRHGLAPFQPERILCAPGTRSFFFEGPQVSIAGELEIPEDGNAELDLDGRKVRLIVRSPARAQTK